MNCQRKTPVSESLLWHLTLTPFPKDNHLVWRDCKLEGKVLMLPVELDALAAGRYQLV